MSNKKVVILNGTGSGDDCFDSPFSVLTDFRNIAKMPLHWLFAAVLRTNAGYLGQAHWPWEQEKPLAEGRNLHKRNDRDRPLHK